MNYCRIHVVFVMFFLVALSLSSLSMKRSIGVRTREDMEYRGLVFLSELTSGIPITGTPSCLLKGSVIYSISHSIGY